MRPLAVLLSLSLAAPASAGYPVVSYSYPSYPVYQAPQVIYRDRVRVKYVEVPVATYVPVQVPVYSAGAAPTYVAPLVPAPAPPPPAAPAQAQPAYAPAPAAQAYAQSPAPYRAHGGCPQNDAVLQALAALARRLDRVERPGAPPSPGAPPAQPAPAPPPPPPAPEDPFNPAPAPPPQAQTAPPPGLAVLQNRCAQCHTRGRLDPGTGLSLFDEGGTALSLGGRELTKALKAVADGSMPPAPQTPLSEADRKALADYLTLTALPPGRDI